MFENHFIKEKILSEFKQRWEDTFKNDLLSLDKELVETLYYLNKVKGLASVFSCQGHVEKENFYICLVVSNKNGIQAIEKINEAFKKECKKANLDLFMSFVTLEFSYLLNNQSYSGITSIEEDTPYPVVTFRIFNNDRLVFAKTKKMFYASVKKTIGAAGYTNAA